MGQDTQQIAKNFEIYLFSSRFDGLRNEGARQYECPYTMLAKGGDGVEMDLESTCTYTLSDIARKLNRPRTTVKEWSDLFREYLPTVGTGRTRRYEESSVDIFAAIAKMKEVSTPNEMIRRTLQQSVQEIAVTTEVEPKPLMMQIAESYTQMLEQLKRMEDERRRQHDELMNCLRALAMEHEERIDKVQLTLASESAELKKRIGRLSDALYLVVEQNETMNRIVVDREETWLQSIRSMQEVKQTFEEVAASIEQQKPKRGWWPFGRK
ncbi:MerR family transcriptional regulator [Alicyclobacillus fastidiosus]|uniref:MerR family transcriptional regulator n=1 Tax=Alicyclobacillus fastidiosus TaxID=392011 RepID=A0ABY6ZJQ2_9BACL|nr:MerR family transcriptional regulator [Alicyclobacillus fastidiosus]WAH43155.1 MerR family transcriptional regulator [Alicyclobacillus fastidiosus]GMA65169.1 hypothetical protein GCM10025859_56090 [Alicyclobacillus fastidiosus]